MRVKRSSLRQNISDVLRKRILDGSLAPGAPLREPAIASELGVSRSPLREALLSLEFEGLLKSEINRGFEVRHLSETTVREVYPMIGCLEGLAAKQGIALLQAALPELRELNAQIRRRGTSPTQRAKLDLRFHRRLAQASGNAHLMEALEQMRSRARLFDRSEERGFISPKGACDEHELILKAIEAGRPAQTARAVEKHWETGIEVVVSWLDENKEEDQ